MIAMAAQHHHSLCVPSMNSAPSGDEEPPVGPPAQPEEALLPRVSDEDSPATSFSRGALTFVGSILLIAIAFSLGLSYLLEKRWSRRAMAASASAGGILKPAMFHVGAVSLGTSHLAIVNGKPVEEGGAVTVSTPSGLVQVRVARIEDGLVRFVYGDEQIEVRTGSDAASLSPP